MTSFNLLMFLLFVSLFGQDPVSQNERIYKINQPEALRTVLTEVIEIKKVENLQSDDFPRDFAIEVKNISKKPIYLIEIFAVLPNAVPGGMPIGFSLRYGKRGLLEFPNRPEPTDIPIAPGETGILKTDESGQSTRKYLEKRMGTSNIEMALNPVVLWFQIINFGDGTGYIVGSPYPVQKASR
jgi:hypothetical protein